MPKEKYSIAGKRIFVAGHRGMVGAAICRRLSDMDCEILTVPRSEVDLLDQSDVRAWFLENRPHAVFMAAAKVGGILANSTRPAEFLHENLVIQSNVIHSAYEAGVEKLLFLGSSCIYPKLAQQPITETALMTGMLEETNEWYAIAKIAGLKMCQAYRKQYEVDFISAMPTNLYGTGDNYDLQSSHVLPALIRKVDEAKALGAPSITLWGSGTPLREFMHADDCADALVFLMQNYSGHQHINVGSGHEVSIRDLAGMIAKASSYKGTIELDQTKPDGTPRKLMDSKKLTAMGWKPRISLEEGIARTVREYEDQRK